VERCRQFVHAEAGCSDWSAEIDPEEVEEYRGTHRADGEEVEVRVEWDRPTMFAVPSTQIAYDLANTLTLAGMPANAVTQDTLRSTRNHIFRRTVARECALVQIDVVSEGVDLPIRRLIDLRPTLSPVKWMQQLGRITRPGVPQPEYICTNRNLERHGYLFDGLLPPSTMATAQTAFAKPSKRAGARVVGLEGLGKFSGTELPLLGGLTGHMYAVTSVEGYKRKDYVILAHPCSSTPIVAYRESTVNDRQERDWGKFQRVERLPDLGGYASAPAKTVSERQAAWWGRDAARFGLDPAAKVTRRNFVALPVLKDLQTALVGSSG
jgi:hypothetical protein